MTSSEAQSPPKLFNMDAVEADAHTLVHTRKHSTCACTQTRGHKCTPCKPAHLQTHYFFFVGLKDNAWLVFARADDEEW